ncbi:hypothetical protein O6P43_007734 [Quillaja saponaria]|uniref:Uncharacterized protein n=1 Tax=Quillaja saponaria TaxID=32244 RepID=A0AAD7VJU6_QUISA|nr:hypothetical protein O6P43_007734 [Quillaja saponaria]
MSFHGQIHHAQSNVLPQISFHSSEQFARYWSPGMANYGSTPFSLDEPAHRGSGNALGPVSGYHLPTSSFQPDLCSHSSSRTQLPPMSPPQAHIPNSLGTGSGGSQFGVRSWTNWSPQNQLAMTEPSTGTHEIQFQGVLGQAAGSSTLYPGATTGSSYLIQPPSMPIQSPGFAGNMMMMYPNQFEMGDPMSSRAVRMRMTMQDIAPASPNLQLGNWMSPASHGLRSPFDYPCSPTPAPRPIKNAVYDPMFETMGLPIDPHLRMFLASRDHHGKGPQL